MSDVSVYIVVNLHVTDAGAYRQYEKGFFPLLKRYGGEFVTYDDAALTVRLRGHGDFDAAPLLGSGGARSDMVLSAGSLGDSSRCYPQPLYPGQARRGFSQRMRTIQHVQPKLRS